MAGDAVRKIQIDDELADIFAIGFEIERQNIGVGQAQRERAPELGHQGVIAIAGIAEMIHPEIIVVERVVDAVGTDESKAHGGDAKKIQKNGVVGAAADAGVGEFSIGNGLVVA